MILLTGATGFLGSRILAALLKTGYEVVIVKRSFSDTKKIAENLEHDRLHIFDIDREDPRKIFETYKIKTIIHAATEYGRGTTPVFKILEANLILPIRLAELGIDYGVKCFINTDSFFNKGNSSYSNLLNYSLSKKSLLVWLNQLSKKLKIINVVLEHIYGPGDDNLKFVENVIQKIAIEKVKKISLTHGHQKRDFIYVDDVVDAYLKLVDYANNHDFSFKTFEVGTGKSFQIRDFVEIVKNISDSQTELCFGDIEYRSDEIMDSKADISQLSELSWMPTTSLKSGIEKILQEYNLKKQTKMRFEKTFSNLIYRLWHHIGRSRRRQFWLLLGLTILASFAEIVSIGSVLPFIGALTNPEKIFDSSAAAPIIQFMGLKNADQLLLPLTIIFSVAALLSGLLRIFSLKLSVKVSFEVGSELSNNVYRKTLYQPYATHIARNSSEVVNVIWVKISEVIFYILMPGLTLISSIAMITAILFALCYVIPGVALGIIGCFGLIYVFIIKISRRHLKESSRRIAAESNNVIKSLQEGLGGIRDILIDGSQESFCAIYRETDRILRTAQGSNQFISQSPRFAMESMGTVLIAGLAYVLSQRPDGITNAIPILAALALGLQRLLPALQQAYNSWSLMQGAHASLQDALDLLDQPMLQNMGEGKIAPLSFENDISLKKVSFRYNSESPWIFEGVDLEIKKGSRVGFIGGTGSGKSTMIDIIMGLLDPARGSLEIDGQKISSENRRTWQSRIAHVPQTVFLTDNSIEENIAFGIPREKISYERVKLAAEQAQLAETIEQWPEGYRTVVGERGIQLSGGQRQRIGIARALYKRADVIVFDEATSALDTETEMAVMLAIESLSKDITILIIAHRLNTLKNCHKIVEVKKEGILIRDMNFSEVIGDFS